MKRTIGTAVLFLLLSGTVWAVDAPPAYDKKCKMCHSIGGAGGPMAKVGGALDSVGTLHDEAWFRAYFKDPKSKKPDAKMPKVSLSDAEWDAIVAYMLTLKAPAPAK